MEVQFEEGMIYVSMKDIPEVACYSVVIATTDDIEGGVGAFDMHPRWMLKLDALAEQSNAKANGWLQHDRISWPCTVRLLLPPNWNAELTYRAFGDASRVVLESEGF